MSTILICFIFIILLFTFSKRPSGCVRSSSACYRTFPFYQYILFCRLTRNLIIFDPRRGPRTLVICLTDAVGMTLAIFCRLVSKTHCCRLNQLKSGLTLKQHPTMHVSILDYIPHLNFDLSGSLKVKYDSVTGLSIYAFLLTFNSNIWPNSAPLWYIKASKCEWPWNWPLKITHG